MRFVNVFSPTDGSQLTVQHKSKQKIIINEVIEVTCVEMKSDKLPTTADLGGILLVIILLMANSLFLHV